MKITMAPEMEEQLARIFAGLSMSDYDMLPGVPGWCDEDQPFSKSDVVALYRTHNLLAAVENDIAARKMKQR